MLCLGVDACLKRAFDVLMVMLDSQEEKLLIACLKLLIPSVLEAAVVFKTSCANSSIFGMASCAW